MDRLHRRVETHRPAPEQHGAFGGRATIGDLLDLAFTAETGHRQDGRAVHGEEHRAAVQEDDRKRVERIVVQVPVANRKSRCPVEVREDAEGHHLTPAANQQRLEEERGVQEDRRGERPRQMRAHVQRRGPTVHAQPPEQNADREEETGHQIPAALL